MIVVKEGDVDIGASRVSWTSDVQLTLFRRKPLS